MNIAAHNLLAINANRQFNIVNKKMAKSMEKLSSGYKVNRAADDASSLSISEKMRRQIKGLHKAIENIQDGISLCQVADGALNEMHDILQRMNELSVKAGNDTNSSIDRSFIQAEIDALTEEIDRISNQTTFNEHIYPLLGSGSFDLNGSGDTSGGATGSSNTSPLSDSDYPGGNLQIVNTSTVTNYSSYVDSNGKKHYQLGSGTFRIEGLTNCVFDVSGNTCIENTKLKNVTINCDAGTVLSVMDVSIDNSANVGYDIKNSKTEIGAAVKFSGKNNKLNCYGNNSFFAGADNYTSFYDPFIKGNYFENKDGIELAASAQLEISGTNTSLLCVQGNMTDTHTEKNVRNSSASGIGGNGDLRINSGHILVNAHGGWGIDVGTIWLNGGQIDAAGNEKDASLIKAFSYMEINGGTINAEGGGLLGNPIIGVDSGGIININDGVIYAYQPSVDILTAFGSAIGSSGDATINISGGTVLAISDSPYSSAIGLGQLSIGLGLYPNGEVNISGGQITVISADKQDAIGCINPMFDNKDIILYVDGQLTDPTGKDDGKGHHVFTYPDSSGSNTGGGIDTGTNIGGSTARQENLWIQMGTEPGIGMFINLVNATAKGIGVDNLDVSSMENAGKAINSIKGALEKVSQYRTVFGSQQNRLEHAMLINENITENTTIAESRIRDADIAEEMVALSNENILAQAGQAMLSQAYQNQQKILSLLS